MSSAITPTASQGVISAQMERVQNDRPTAAAPPQPEPAPEQPLPPPPPSGRGESVDTSA